MAKAMIGGRLANTANRGWQRMFGLNRLLVWAGNFRNDDLCKAPYEG